MKKQSTAPLFEGILHYISRGITGFHTPGHRQGAGLDEEFVATGLELLDLTELPDLDGASMEQRRAEAEQLAAKFFGADISHFLVNGATEGILAVLLGLGQPGESIIVAGDCHISVVHGLILSGLKPVFLPPQWVPGWSLPMLPAVETLKTSLEKHPSVCAVWITHPSYAGVIGELGALAQVTRGKRVPLIIDEAHGGYLEMAGLKTCEARDVADAWVQGTHKVMGSLTQTAMLHLRGEKINKERITRTLAWVRSTSPSYPLLVSLDSLRRRLAARGRAQFSCAAERTVALRHKLVAAGADILLPGPLFQIDPMKLVVSFLKQGWTGCEAGRHLTEEFRIQPEFFDRDQVGFFFSPAQQEDDWRLLAQAVTNKGWSNQRSALSRLGPPPLTWREMVISPREAGFAPINHLPLLGAEGHIAATAVAPYPPGIPLWIPGERIAGEAIHWLKEFIVTGGNVTGVFADGQVPVIT